MKTFTVISQLGEPAAFLVEHKLTPVEFFVLDQMSRGNLFEQRDLAERWGLDSVFATDDWAAEQRRRQPMLKPKGPRLAILEAKAC